MHAARHERLSVGEDDVLVSSPDQRHVGSVGRQRLTEELDLVKLRFVLTTHRVRLSIIQMVSPDKVRLASPDPS
jgi:hypothetical protein